MLFFLKTAICDNIKKCYVPGEDCTRFIRERRKKMKGCAKFLNFIAFLVFLLIFIAFLGACAATAVVGIKPDLIPADLLESLTAVTINGEPVTMEILTGFRVPVLILLGSTIVFLLIGLFTIAKIRTALREVGRGEPFSVECSKALNTAAILEVISGLFGIALSIYAAFAFGGVSVDGGTVINYTANLSFILVAVFLKMLSGVSEFGRR